jgi:uncharacterized protein YbjQ (UPF0145 family)
MLKFIRLLGSSSFALGVFAIIFVGMPWLVTIVNNPDIGGPLPWWFKGSVYLLLGGVAVVMISVAIEQFILRQKPGKLEQEIESEDLLVENIDYVPGREVSKVLGMVQGHTVYAIWLGNDISALVKLILGGELTEYTEMMGKARTLAVQRMNAQARELEADAVMNVRFMTTSVVGTASELLAYGTAVKLVPLSR